MNTIPVLITMILTSSAIAMASASASTSTSVSAEDEEFQASYDALFGWPSFTNHQESADLIKRFRCGLSVHHVYSCFRLSLFKFHPHKFNLLHPAEDCCTAIGNFRDKCGDFNIAKFESFIFPPLVFKKCSAPPAASAPAPTPGPAPAPATAADQVAADIEV